MKLEALPNLPALGPKFKGSKDFKNVTDEIKKLNPVQQEFMIKYGKWMDEFIEVIKIQKIEPGNSANKQKMIALTDMAEKMKPELSEYMKDANFALIYQASIARMRDEI